MKFLWQDIVLRDHSLGAREMVIVFRAFSGQIFFKVKILFFLYKSNLRLQPFLLSLFDFYEGGTPPKKLELSSGGRQAPCSTGFPC